MGHDMYVWPLRPFQPGTPLPPKETAVAHLRMNAAEGRHSPLYEIFDARQCNKIDSGDGSVILVIKKEFQKARDRAKQHRLLPSEEEFLETIEKAAPHGFAIFFE